MMRATLLAGVLAIVSIASARAQVEMHPDGGVSCPGAHYARRLDGRLVIVCPPPPVSQQRADEFGREWLRSHEAEAARQETDRMTRRCKEEPRPSFCK